MVAMVRSISTVVMLIGGSLAVASAQTDNSWLRQWIPIHCCVTNQCCWEITPKEVQSLDGDKWEVLATGQVLKRTNWSPDGKYYRCACDLVDGQWIRHLGANTRCIFPPMQSVKLIGKPDRWAAHARLTGKGTVF
jgi:hypothetical protein